MVSTPTEGELEAKPAAVVANNDSNRFAIFNYIGSILIIGIKFQEGLEGLRNGEFSIKFPS